MALMKERRRIREFLVLIVPESRRTRDWNCWPVMKLLFLGVFFLLATTSTSFAEANKPNTRQLIKAIENDDINTVRNYIHFHGNPNKVIEADRYFAQGNTLLHHAAAFGSKNVADLLLKSGADPLRMNASMQYPIELAVKEKKEDIIKLLSRPEDKRDTEEVTAELLHRIYTEECLAREANDIGVATIYVSIDGKDPSKTQMKHLGALCKQFVPHSKIPIFPDKNSKEARAAKSKIVELGISRKPSANGISYVWGISIGAGPLSGYGRRGSFSQRYGYWIKSETSYWVS